MSLNNVKHPVSHLGNIGPASEGDRVEVLGESSQFRFSGHFRFLEKILQSEIRFKFSTGMD